MNAYYKIFKTLRYTDVSWKPIYQIYSQFSRYLTLACIASSLTHFRYGYALEKARVARGLVTITIKIFVRTCQSIVFLFHLKEKNSILIRDSSLSQKIFLVKKKTHFCMFDSRLWRTSPRNSTSSATDWRRIQNPKKRYTSSGPSLAVCPLVPEWLRHHQTNNGPWTQS